LVIGAVDQGSAWQYQVCEVSFPDGAVLRITNDLNSYHGMGITADGNSLVTVKDEVEAKLWASDKGARRDYQEIDVPGRLNGMYSVFWSVENQIFYTSVSGASAELRSIEASGSGQKQVLDLGGEAMEGLAWPLVAMAGTWWDSPHARKEPTSGGSTQTGRILCSLRRALRTDILLARPTASGWFTNRLRPAHGRSGRFRLMAASRCN